MMASQFEAKKAFEFFKTLPGVIMKSSMTKDMHSILHTLIYNDVKLASMVVSNYHDGHGDQVEYLYEKA